HHRHLARCVPAPPPAICGSDGIPRPPPDPVHSGRSGFQHRPDAGRKLPLISGPLITTATVRSGLYSGGMMKHRGLLLVAVATSTFAQQKISAPRIWNDRDLAEWATPLASLKLRPGHLSEKEYYAIPNGDWVRSYPVYFPGREPEGYWQMVQSKKPEPL